METKINAAYSKFAPIAIRGRILFHLLAEMTHVNHMYQTSLDQFTTLVVNAAAR